MTGEQAKRDFLLLIGAVIKVLEHRESLAHGAFPIAGPFDFLGRYLARNRSERRALAIL